MLRIQKPQFTNVFSSVAQSCPILCDPMVCSTPGFPVHHQLPELTQIHVHQVSDAIQPSHPLSSPSLPAFNLSLEFSSIHFSHSVVSDSLQPHESQHARPPCPSPTPRVYSKSGPLSRWCHPTSSSSVVPFSSRLQSFPASGSFPMSQFFASGAKVSASASVLPMNIQDWFPLGLTGWISLLSKGLSRVFSTTTVQKH